jgi:hypothetical protein
VLISTLSNLFLPGSDPSEAIWAPALLQQTPVNKTNRDISFMDV